MKPTRIVDAHQHVFWHGRDDAGLVADMDQQGIEKAVLMTWLIDASEPNVGGEETFNPVTARVQSLHPGLTLADEVMALRRFLDRFIAGYAPHPLDPNAIPHLDAAVRMYNVRICAEWKFRLALDDPRCLEVFHWCGPKKLAVVFHIDVPYRPDPQTGKPKYDPQWYGGNLGSVERALAACPETILVGHGPGFWRHIAADHAASPKAYPDGPVTPGPLYGLMDKYPNFWLDLSGFSGLNSLKRDPAHGVQFVRRYHQRLMFARDTYGGDLHAFLQTLDLNSEITENVYHRNIERLLRKEV